MISTLWPAAYACQPVSKSAFQQVQKAEVLKATEGSVLTG
jgi:hypothetical protein